MKLSIITVSYNTKDLTLQTLRTAIEEINASKLLKDQTEIFVVDNDSKDGSPQACEEFFKKAKFLHFKVFANKENLGFARANNQATEVAKGEYIILLNSDTITRRGGLSLLVEAMDAHPVQEQSANGVESGNFDRLGIITPSLLNPDGSLQNQGGSLPSLATIASQMLFLDDLPLIGRFFPSTQHNGHSGLALHDLDNKNTQLIAKDWVAGTAMLIRRQLIDEIGMLDGNIFMYGEDQEYCMRARHHHWDIAIHPQARITHFGCASSSSRNAIHGEFKGYLYIFKKHMPAWQLPLLKAILFAGALMRQMIYAFRKQEIPAGIYKDAIKLLY